MKKFKFLLVLFLIQSCVYPSEKAGYGAFSLYVGDYSCLNKQYHVFEIGPKNTYKNEIFETDTLKIENKTYGYVYLYEINGKIDYQNNTLPLDKNKLYLPLSRKTWSRRVVKCKEAFNLNAFENGYKIDF